VCAGLEACGVAHSSRALTSPEQVADITPTPGLVVFNLVESPPGAPRQQVEIAGAFERHRLPFTGSDAAAIWLTTDKVATRQRLAAAGLPLAAGAVIDPSDTSALAVVPPPWIIKPAWEDASLGLDGSLLNRTTAEARARTAELAKRFPDQPLLVEHFLPGREFNLALLGGDDKDVEVLPTAEMLYVDFAPHEARVLGYEAKWNRESDLYRRTVRRFLDPEVEAGLSGQLGELARQTWELCGLSGYGRIDMRLDEAGRPCVLEANANPCLSADAGFMAAMQQAGYEPRHLVGRILADALRRNL